MFNLIRGFLLDYFRVKNEFIYMPYKFFQKLVEEVERHTLLQQMDMIRHHQGMIEMFGPPVILKFLRETLIPLLHRGKKFNELDLKLTRFDTEHHKKKIYQRCIK